MTPRELRHRQMLEDMGVYAEVEGEKADIDLTEEFHVPPGDGFFQVLEPYADAKPLELRKPEPLGLWQRLKRWAGRS